MKSVIIYCNYKDDVDTNRLLKTVVDELVKSNHETLVYSIFGDFYSTKFLSYEEEDLPHIEKFDEIIKNIQAEIAKSDHIVFVFPEYWEKLTYYVRRFIDLVFLSEWGGGKLFTVNHVLSKTKATIITSMQIPQILFSGRSSGGQSNPFALSILKLCGIRNIKWFNVSGWSEQNPKIKEKKIEKMRNHFQQISGFFDKE